MVYKYAKWTMVSGFILIFISLAFGSAELSALFAFVAVASMFVFISIWFYRLIDKPFAKQYENKKTIDKSYSVNDIKSFVIGKYEIDYMDREKEVTNRFVTVYSCDGYYMYAFCSLRMAPRTFKLDNVIRAVDMETGEIVINMQNHITEKVKNDPRNTVKTALTTLLPFVRILLYVARADGRMMTPERRLIVDFIVNKSDMTLSTEAVDVVIKRIETPSKEEFLKIVELLAKTDPAKLNEILEYAKLIVATQKVVHPWEEEAIAYMESQSLIHSPPLDTPH